MEIKVGDVFVRSWESDDGHEYRIGYTVIKVTKKTVTVVDTRFSESHFNYSKMTRRPVETSMGLAIRVNFNGAAYLNREVA